MNAEICRYYSINSACCGDVHAINAKSAFALPRTRAFPVLISYCRAGRKSYAEISVDVTLEHFPYLFVLSVDAFLQQPIILGLLRAIRLCTPNYGRRRKRNGRD